MTDLDRAIREAHVRFNSAVVAWNDEENADTWSALMEAADEVEALYDRWVIADMQKAGVL